MIVIGQKMRYFLYSSLVLFVLELVLVGSNQFPYQHNLKLKNEEVIFIILDGVPENREYINSKCVLKFSLVAKYSEGTGLSYSPDIRLFEKCFN